MYNAKPHYNRFSSEINLPENYSGNAFSDTSKIQASYEDVIVSENDDDAEEKEVIALQREVKEASPASVEKKKNGLGFDLSKLFGGSIGTEELLILGLILLLKDSEDSDDIILLLVFLLLLS